MTCIHEHHYDNGLRLVAEPVAGAQSLAMSFLLPAGVSQEPQGGQGYASLLSELIFRGAGDLDARAHSNALDHLGVQRDANVGMAHMRVSATMVGKHMREALPLILSMITSPRLADESLEPCRLLALQSLDALEDEPQHKVFDELRKRHYPQPFGRSPHGLREPIEIATPDDLRAFWRGTCVPDGAILGIAGQFDWTELRQIVGDLTADWQGRREEANETTPGPRGYQHEKAESVQVHIGLAYDAVPEIDDASMLQRTAAAVLSGGMSGRLFTEVREKRGLCYAVGARYTADKHRGAMLAYAGTTSQRAQETLDVLSHELRRISEGVEQDEFDRAVVGMKSGLVMEGESTSARAGAIAADQFIYGRPRSLDALIEEIDAVTLDRVNDFVRSHPVGDMTIVTVGPDALTVQEAAAARS